MPEAEPLVTLADDLTVIQINYEPGTPDPSRIFRSMAGLIETFQHVDRHLAHSVAATIEPTVVLERVEAGSIRAILRTLLIQVDDEALHNLDWKPLIGQYLVRGKHFLLRWLDGRPRIASHVEVVELQQGLRQLAPRQMTDRLLPPAPVPVEELLHDMESLSRAVVQLLPADSAELISAEEVTRIETGLVITEQDIESLLTESVDKIVSEMMLLVKKPDYLGNSMWEFRLPDHAIEAKMLDDDWLQRFRRQEIPLQPGDALRAIVRTETAHGFEGHDVAVHYYVVRVLGVVHVHLPEQGDLLE
jgi:hypothetical protein